MSEQQDGGFTLVELLVVVVVLGILAVVVVAGVAGIQSRAETSACDIELRTLKTAQVVYEADGGAALADGSTGDELVTAGLIEKVSTLWAWDADALGVPPDPDWAAAGAQCA